MAKISSPQGGGLENGARGIEVDFLLGLQQHPRAVLDIPAAPDTSEAQWPLAAVSSLTRLPPKSSATSPYFPLSFKIRQPSPSMPSISKGIMTTTVAPA